MFRCHIFPIVLSLAAFFFASCASRQTAALFNDIETYIQNCPDSAFKVISAVDTTELNVPRLRAHYSLLYAMALDKIWIDTTDENVVMPAVVYYDHHPSRDQRAKAWYYLGRIQYNGNNYTDAIVSFSRASEYAEPLDDDRFKSLIFQAMGDTYMQSYLPDEASQYSEQAYQFAMSAGDTMLAYASLFRKTEALYNLKRLEEADSLYRFLLTSRTKINEHTYPIILADYANMQVIYRENYEEAVRLFEESLALSKGLPGINYWCAFAYALFNTGETVRAESIINQLSSTSSDTYPYKIWKSRIEALKGNYQTSYELLKLSYENQSKGVISALRQSAARSQRDFFAAEKARAEETRKMMEWVYALSVLLLLSLFIIGYMAIRRRHDLIRQKNILLQQENDSLQKAMLSLSDNMTEMNVQQARLRREYTVRLQSSFREWSQLYKAFFFHSGDSAIIDVRENVYYEARKAIARMAGDSEGQRMLEDRLNELFEKVMVHYREDFPDREEREYHFVSFVFAGFDATVLKAAFQIPSIPATYERKSRLKENFLRSSAKHKEQYLLFFR